MLFRSKKKVMHSRKEEQQARRVLLIIGVAALVLVVAMLVGGRGSYQDLFNTRQHHRETASTTFLGAEFDASSHLFDDEHTDGQA